MDLGKKGVKRELDNRSGKRAKTRSHSLFYIFKLFLIACLLCCCLGAAVGVGMIKGILDDAPEITLQDVIPSEQKSVIYDCNGKQIETLVQAGSNRTNVKKIDKVPKDLINAFIAVEDSRFWEHNGIDLKGIMRAAVNGIASGFHFSEGASTITQQLIKNNVFDNWLEEQSLGDRLERKIQEQYLAVKLEEDPNVTKEDILLSYLNTINCGSNTLGIYQASRRYFGKSYKKLTLSECAVLAAITNSPVAYNPITHPDENRKRVKKVLEDMEAQGYITAKERKKALKDNVYKRIAKVNKHYSQEEEIANSYFVDAVIEQVSEKLQEERGYTQAQATNLLYSGGLRIYSTMDPAIQDIIDEQVNDESYYPDEIVRYSANFMITVTYEDNTKETFTEISLKQYFRKKNASFKFLADSKEEIDDYIKEFALSIINPKRGETWEMTRIDYTLQPQVSFTIMEQDTGYIRGIAGGRGKKVSNLSLNRATASVRQPGSLFKVLGAAAPALDACGDTLSTTYYDGPYSIGEKEFSNYWSSGYKGYSTIRQALVYSMNIVTLKCMNETVTPSLAFEYLEDFGFTTLVESKTASDGQVYSDINATLCLGGLTDGVSNLETTAAYAAIANQGTYIEPRFYSKVVDSDGNVILDNKPEKRQVIKKTTAFLLTKAMEECMRGDYYPGTGLTGTGAAADFPGMATAGKTGTTSNTCDIWFAGFTPYYTAVVWSGYDEMTEIPTDASYHKYLWRGIMRRVHESLPNKGFKEPKGITTAYVCSKSGKLATQACSADVRGSYAYKEYYVSGTEPTDYCNRHYGVTICTESNMIAKSDCKNTSYRGYMSLGSDADGYSMDYDADGAPGICPIDHVEEERKRKEEEERKQKEEEERLKKEEEEQKRNEQNQQQQGNEHSEEVQQMQPEG